MLLLQPQEVEVYYVLPAIRSEIARALKATGHTQTDIAKLLGVTPAAISHYLNGNRGAEFSVPKDLHLLASEAATRITDHASMIRETQVILAALKETRAICKLHERVNGHIAKGCSICFDTTKEPLDKEERS